MVEKVMVSREVAEQIDIGVNLHHGEGIFLEHHAEMVGRWRGNSAILNDITTWKMAQILVIGYEIEETPEEKILATYQRQRAWQETNDPYDRRAHTAYGNAIVYTLDTLGIEIEGINK